ncbi:MAG TPA: hypothetical protein VGL29_07495 [Blastocatellia bacterium]|jgi:hypothetical protein
MRFRLAAILFCLIAVGEFALPSPAGPKADADAWVKAKVDALVSAARAAYENNDALPAYKKVLSSIAVTIRRRKLAEDANFASRYREFVDYVETASLAVRPDHELGFEIPDKQYFEETRRYVQIPDLLLAPSFLRWVSRFETLDRAKTFLRQLNNSREAADQLIFFSYTSRHLGTPDNDDSFVRLLIVVPGNPEKWVQFGVTDPKTRVRIRNVSVVSAITNSDGTFNAYFKDYFRTYRRSASISIKGRWELGYGDDYCASCHKSGILPVFPEPGSVSADEQPALAAANERFRSYGSPRFQYLDLNKLGPGLGSSSTLLRVKRFGEAFGETVVGRSMNCNRCHQQQWLGALNWPMDRVLISSYIKGGRMPSGSRLSDSERDELHEKLIQEYFAIDDAAPGILKSWLLGKRR